MTKLSSQHQVDKKIDRGIENQREVIEAGETEEPGGRSEVWAAADEITGHDDFVTVEDDSGDVTAEEHTHDAEDDEGKIYFSLHRLSLATVWEPCSSKDLILFYMI